MIGTNFKDVTDNPAKRLSDSPLGKLLENFSETMTGKYDSSLAKGLAKEAAADGSETGKSRGRTDEASADIPKENDDSNGKKDAYSEKDEKTENAESDRNEESKEGNEVSQAVQNKRDGCEREDKVEQELRKKYPESEGYQIVKEVYLRDKDGNFVLDPETGKRRRIDFVVVKDGKVVDSVEVTSETAPKEGQMAKEQRIRDNGGNYIRDNDGNLVEFPADVKTRIERRE